MLIWGSRGLMVRESDSWARVSGPAGIVGEGSESTSLSLLPQYPNEVSLSKALNPQLLPGSRSINGCPLLRVCVCVFYCVCVHFEWVKCRAQILSKGNHTWPRHFHFTFFILCLHRLQGGYVNIHFSGSLCDHLYLYKLHLLRKLQIPQSAQLQRKLLCSVSKFYQNLQCIIAV